MARLQAHIGRIAMAVALLAGIALCFAGRVSGEGGAAVKEDRVSYIDNGTVRIGVNLDLGGAITYLTGPHNPDNLVNSADWGRQIQMSDYSGPVPFAPNGKQPEKTWAGLGWNPIQSGDCYGNRSKVIDCLNDGKSLYVKCIPMQWPLNNEPGECTFECWLTPEGNAVHVRSRLVNHRSDKTQYQGRGQELPAIYTNGPWYRLLTYAGDEPFTNGALKTIPAAMPWSGWQATENWAALVNDAGNGLGVWEPGVYQFIGGFAGKPGAGGPKDGPTGYIAPLYNEILDYNIVYEYQYTLIVGSIDEIRQYVYQHAERPKPPAWRFEKDRQHWYFVNATDAGWPIQGELKVSLAGNDPQMIGPPGFWRAEDAPKLYIEAAYQTGPARAEVFWARPDGSFDAAHCVNFDVIPDGAYHTYEVNLAASPEYQGIITGLRFDPVPAGKAGEFVRVKSISFTKARG